MICASLVLLTLSMIDASVVDLPEPVGPTIKTNPRGCELTLLISSSSPFDKPNKSKLSRLSSKLNNLNGKDVFLQSGVATILQYSCAENGLSVASIPQGNELIYNHELLETYVTICMNVLDKAGYYSDKENDVLKLRSRTNDVSHAIYGAVTNYFITDDTRLAKRIFSTYSFLGIQTKILNTKEFMLI